MINFTQGNLLEAKVEALVNTVNTVGVMGKGIALMFKERFPLNFREYEAACKNGALRVGHMFVTANSEFSGPRWIINFPTKEQWFRRTKIEWVKSGLTDLKRVILEKQIKSIALPPLGCGNGGLNWSTVRPLIEFELSKLDDVDIIVYEPTPKYQNVAKKHGVEILTPARAMIAEMIRRYWVLGIECTLLETHKLAWFLERNLQKLGFENELDLRFKADRYGPYAFRLDHLLNQLDGSYLHCDKRIADARPFDTIWFDESKHEKLSLYLRTAAGESLKVVESTDKLIDGFQSPLGLEVLATVDWLVSRENCATTPEAIRHRLHSWKGGPAGSAERKNKLFSDTLIKLSLDRLIEWDDFVESLSV